MGRRSRELYSQGSHPMVRDPQMGGYNSGSCSPKGGWGGVQAFLRKQEKSLINSLTLHLKKLENEEQDCSYLVEGNK